MLGGHNILAEFAIGQKDVLDEARHGCGEGGSDASNSWGLKITELFSWCFAHARSKMDLRTTAHHSHTQAAMDPRQNCRLEEKDLLAGSWHGSAEDATASTHNQMGLLEASMKSAPTTI